ncbi:hypothetical protein [Dermatophilus congolensis]|uniref:Uncharacterized protein n=1 Tax=Dermatophilus congolensis TaxID=1863 RepID=A0A239V8B7_9MICO|nr:hypothetical protein [Dermatophilus congolensis]MBO3130470.1 hypothetical protein [Dermatophilus congolensis]MBO3130900.1 hypothetical protein [Dermatophilus congolensis]MBO3134942.1 hypothetical protein [Dermatophilus congolensis]MBO3137181.1 hypothetical protein [Dermatophilus congolensis]MBO3139424.1 hypothetical protein [Dermatophilus congolensis]
MAKKKKTYKIPSLKVTVPTLAGLWEAAEPKLSDAADVARDTATSVAQRAEESFEKARVAARDTADSVASQAEGRAGDLRSKWSEIVTQLEEASDVDPQVWRERAVGARAVMRGDAVATPVKKKCAGFGGVLGVAVVLAAAGAAYYVLKQRQAEYEDPWARPLTDPYAAPTSGRTSSVSDGAASGTKPGQISTLGQAPTGDGMAPTNPEQVHDASAEAPENPKNS